MLHRRHRAIDEHQLDLGIVDLLAQLLDLAGAEEMSGMGIAQRHDGAADDLEIGKRRGQSHRFLEGHIRVAPIPVRPDVRMQDPRAGHMRCVFFQSLPSPS